MQALTPHEQTPAFFAHRRCAVLALLVSVTVLAVPGPAHGVAVAPGAGSATDVATGAASGAEDVVGKVAAPVSRAGAPAQQAVEQPLRDAASALDATVDQTTAAVQRTGRTLDTPAPRTPGTGDRARPPAEGHSAPWGEATTGPRTGAAAGTLFAVTGALEHLTSDLLPGWGAQGMGAFAYTPRPTSVPARVTAATSPGDEPSPPSHGVDAGSAASGSTASGLGLAALLAVVLALMAPQLRRRLRIPPARWRPAAFVPLLERPG
jgi:hypothetical protein